MSAAKFARGGLAHKWFSAIDTIGTADKVGANVTVFIDREPQGL
jgi:hypothetical protein